MSFYENTPEKLPQLHLMVQAKTQLEYSSYIDKVGVEATC